MAEQDDEQMLWNAQMRATVAFAKTREWTLKTEDPNPDYDDKRGWALDQFAMHCEPRLLRRYKELLIDADKPLIEQKYAALDFLEAKGELESEVKNHFLHDRFRVTGFRPGDEVSTIVPRALLENMLPDIVLSELIEATPLEPRRRFEYVRIFDLQVRAKGARGRPTTYDWETLAIKLDREKPDIFSEADLVRYCRIHVRPMPGKTAPMDGPDDKTIREAIARDGLKNFVKSMKPG